MIYNIINYSDIDMIYLHDAELESIIVDYKGKTAEIVLGAKSVQESPAERVILVFQGVAQVQIPLHEPWGQGHYVNEIKACQNANECRADTFKTQVTLNSGDVIEVVCAELYVNQI